MVWFLGSKAIDMGGDDVEQIWLEFGGYIGSIPKFV